MKWIKEILVDLIVTVVIVTAVFTELSWLGMIVVIYSPLMLILKGLVALNSGLLELVKPRQSTAPSWVPHLLYGMNCVFLLGFGWWITGVIWIGIWGLSWHTDRKMESRRRARTAQS